MCCTPIPSRTYRKFLALERRTKGRLSCRQMEARTRVSKTVIGRWRLALRNEPVILLTLELPATLRDQLEELATATNASLAATVKRLVREEHDRVFPRRR